MITARRRRRSSYLISVAEGALTLASRHGRANLPKEVGGVLVGWREGKDVIVVHELLFVPHDGSVATRYDREHGLADELLQDYLAEADDPRLGYVGEWHTHPEPFPPSPMDLKTIRGIAACLQDPVALIVLMAHRGGHSIEPTGRIAARTSSRNRLHDAHISTH